MTRRNIAQRLERIEAKRAAPLEVFICWCPDGELHHPDCPAAAPGADDGLWITWDDAEAVDHA